jgi:hypothetical protein
MAPPSRPTATTPSAPATTGHGRARGRAAARRGAVGAALPAPRRTAHLRVESPLVEPAAGVKVLAVHDA